VGTAFLSELAQGDTVYNGSAVLIGTIASVTDNTNAVLTVNGAAAITGAAYLIIKANPRVILIGDKSGNSSTNVLCLNGVNGNFASAADAAALDITGDIDLRFYGQLVSWASGAIQVLVAKYTGGAGQRSYQMYLSAAGNLQFTYSANGTAELTALSSVATGLAAFSSKWVRATYASASGNVNFYTSDDGSSWTLLGTQQTITSGAIFSSTSSLTVGCQTTSTFLVTGNVFRAQVYNGIAGTLAFDANFSLPAKLATSFTESSSNAATVTINTSGATGARICGARDGVNLTAGQQPTVSALNVALWDGVNDYLKAAGFALPQPCTIYLVGSQVTWTITDVLMDGNAIGTGQIVQTTTTPQLNINAGSSVAANTGLALATSGVLTAVFNAASSALRVNRGTATTGNAGAGNMNGFTLGASATPTLFTNMTAQAVLIYNVAHTTAQQSAVVAYLGQRYGVAV